jgi:predicted enzyme related to lactoylglutathione lyase
MTAPTTGRFVWHELHTTDRAKAVKFYGSLIGWETKDVQMGPGEPYTLCLLNGKDHAGITKSMAPAHVPSHWLPYLAVDDVDASLAKAEKLGARVLMKATDIPNVGRFAPIADPQGAVFALFKGAREYPEEPAVPPVTAFCWEELVSTDPEASAKFYSELFGYEIESMDMGPMGIYRILKRGDRQTAGIMKSPPNVSGSHWLEYIHVKEVDASTNNARELGAAVLMPLTDIPKIGRFSVITDPTGAAIALFTGA